MSKAKRILLTVGVAVLAIGVVVGVTFLGMFFSLASSSAIPYLNTQYQINLPEGCKTLYSFERTSGLPSDGITYHEYGFEEGEKSFMDDFCKESNEEFTDGWTRYFGYLKDSDSSAKELSAHIPNFDEEYCWRLISRKTAGRKEFEGSFADESERKDFYFGADLLYCVVIPSTNRLYVLEYTL